MPVDFSPVKLLSLLKPDKSEAKKAAAALKDGKAAKNGSSVKLTAGLTGLAALGVTAVLMGNKNGKLKEAIAGVLENLLNNKNAAVPIKPLPLGNSSKIQKPFLFPLGLDSAAVESVAFKDGLLKTDSGALFSGVAVYRLPDSSKVSIAFLDGLIEESQKEDVNGLVQFVKKYTRKITEDGRQVLTVKTTDSTPVEKTFVKTITPKADSVTTIYSRAEKQGNIKVQNLILSDTKDAIKMLDGTKEGKARIIEIDKNTKAKRVVEKDESFNLRPLGVKDGIECFTIENQFSK